MKIGNDNRPLIWILDEDMQLICVKGLTHFSDSLVMEKFGIDVGWIYRFTLRTQMLDLHYSRDGKIRFSSKLHHDDHLEGK